MNEKKVLAGGGIFLVLFVTACLVMVAKCFEYSLWCFTGKDVAWYLDLLGGLVINGLNIPLAILCAILRACGVETPFFHIGG